MARPDKTAAVADLKEQFASSDAVVLTEYRGLTVKNLKELRRSLGENANYAVTKNTLTQIAARQAGVEGLDEQLTGPTAIAFIRGDVAAVAKGLRDFAKAHPPLVIKAGVMDGRVLDADAVRKLADLESREVLLAKLAGAMQGTMQKAVSLLAAPLSQAARAFAALETKVGEDSSAQGGADQAPDSDEQAPAGAEQTPAADDMTIDNAEAPHAAAADAASAADAPSDAADAAPTE